MGGVGAGFDHGGVVVFVGGGDADESAVPGLAQGDHHIAAGKLVGHGDEDRLNLAEIGALPKFTVAAITAETGQALFAFMLDGGPSQSRGR